VRTAAESVNRTDTALRTSADDVNRDLKVSRIEFDSRRYAREAQYNQSIAGLYEIQVRKSSLESDRHRKRSAFFFYGMLATQAGVTIASLALAVRRRSILWGLAGLLGLASLVWAAIVYFDVAVVDIIK
jgi:hypothetical protein